MKKEKKEVMKKYAVDPLTVDRHHPNMQIKNYNYKNVMSKIIN